MTAPAAPTATLPITVTHADEQHPRNENGTWQAHCNFCGVYVDDMSTEPPVDLLCDDCQEDGEDW